MENPLNFVFGTGIPPCSFKLRSGWTQGNCGGSFGSAQIGSCIGEMQRDFDRSLVLVIIATRYSRVGGDAVVVTDGLINYPASLGVSDPAMFT